MDGGGEGQLAPGQCLPKGLGFLGTTWVVRFWRGEQRKKCVCQSSRSYKSGAGGMWGRGVFLEPR